VTNAGIVFARAGQPATGLNIGGTLNLGYHWLDTAASYQWDSGLAPALNQWSLAAIVVEPDRATAYLIDSTGLRSATNVTTHAARAFTDNIRIGGDPNNVNRTFDGRIDEVAIFDRALSAAQVQSLYTGEAVDEGAELQVTRGENNQITITWDGAGTLQSTTALQEENTQWTNETTTGNSFTTTASGDARFFRIVR
jgi:YD repeat-containing protein